MKTTIRGIAYPLTLAGGSLKLHSDDELCRDALLSVINTQVGERLMLPNYGTRRDVLTAAADLQGILQDLETRLYTQVGKDYPQLELRLTGSLDGGGKLAFTVEWSLGGIPKQPLQLLY